MISPRCSVEPRHMLRLVPAEQTRDAQRGNRFPVVHQGGRLADAQRCGFFVTYRESDWRGPGVAAGVDLQRFVIENVMPRQFVHWTSEWRQRAVSNSVDGGEVCRRECNPW